jgi:hypothetical protein
MRRIAAPRPRGSIVIAVVSAVALLAVLVLSGCTWAGEGNQQSQTALEGTGTIQAELPVESTATTEASASVTPTTPAKPAGPTLWPAKVGTFAKSFKKGAWYPAYLPSGYKTDTIDIMEMGTRTGLVCAVMYLAGEKVLIFTQGSPTERTYDVVSAGKVPWGSGTDKADIMYQDPEDTSTPPMIIYSKGGTFIELQGDPSLDELKKIAASMVPVK